MSLKNIKRSFQNAKRDIADVRNQISKLSVDIAASVARTQKLETEVEDLKKAAAKSKKRK